MTVAPYELAMQRIDIEFDVPQFDVSGLVRAISENAGHLPADKRDRYQLAFLAAAQARSSSHFAVLETQVFVPVPRWVLHVRAFRLRLSVFCFSAKLQIPVSQSQTPWLSRKPQHQFERNG
jgi:hypothetical protein